MLTKLHIDIKSESVSKLIECLSKGLGALYEPTRIVRKAKADATAALISAEGDIKKQKLMTRAAQRLAHVEARRQDNIEAIASEAMKALPESVSKTPVSEDWSAHFFECCQDIGEEDMQKLWARILANEVAKPGAFSRRTLQILKGFSKTEAEYFTKYCSFSFTFGGDRHFTFGVNTFHKVIGQGVEHHLIDAGLIREQERFSVSHFPNNEFSYFKTRYRIELAEHYQGLPYLSMRYFSTSGEELSRIVQCKEVANYVRLISGDLTPMGIYLAQVRKKQS